MPLWPLRAPPPTLNCTTEGDRLIRFSVSLLAKAATRLHFVFAFVLTTRREDPVTVREAWNGCQTVVTANEDDFIRYTLKHQKRDSGQECNNAWGLLIVPNLAAKREWALAAIKRGRSIVSIAAQSSLGPPLFTPTYVSRSTPTARSDLGGFTAAFTARRHFPSPRDGIREFRNSAVSRPERAVKLSAKVESVFADPCVEIIRQFARIADAANKPSPSP